MSFIELPFGFPGRVFRSPMPIRPLRYSIARSMTAIVRNRLRSLSCLASDEECLHKTGCHLRSLSFKAGFQVLYLPIPDFRGCQPQRT